MLSFFWEIPLTNQGRARSKAKRTAIAETDTRLKAIHLAFDIICIMRKGVPSCPEGLAVLLVPAATGLGEAVKFPPVLGLVTTPLRRSGLSQLY